MVAIDGFSLDCLLRVPVVLGDVCENFIVLAEGYRAATIQQRYDIAFSLYCILSVK